jgi:hypothetical protein
MVEDAVTAVVADRVVAVDRVEDVAADAVEADAVDAEAEAVAVEDVIKYFDYLNY